MKKFSFSQFATAFIVLLVFGFFVLPALFIVLLNGKTYYIPLILVSALGLYSFLLLFIFNISLSKKGKKIYAGSLLVAVLLTLIQPIYEWIDNQIATVNAEVDIYQYVPFVEGNQVVSLPEPSLITIPTSASANAIESLIPSPTIASNPFFFNSFT